MIIEWNGFTIIMNIDDKQWILSNYIVHTVICALNMHLICTKNINYRRCSFGIKFLNHDAKFAPNTMLICPK